MPTDNNSQNTHNFDISGLCQRISRFIDEALKSQSANAAFVMEWDLKRLKAYLNACVSYRSWIIANPQLDTPESHPMDLQLRVATMAAIDSVENESVKDWARLMWVAHFELSNSQSSRMSTGLISHDQRRFDDIITKLANFLDTYVADTLPLDLPETAPMAPGVERGNLGV